MRPNGLLVQRWKEIQGQVETFSYQGGTIFRVRWKLFQGKEERFSYQGGNGFMLRWKDFQGKVERKSGREINRWNNFQGINLRSI